jgi:hypothetical protein
VRNITATSAFRFAAQIQPLAILSRKPLPYFADTKFIRFARVTFHAPLRTKYGVLSLNCSRRPRLFQISAV